MNTSKQIWRWNVNWKTRNTILKVSSIVISIIWYVVGSNEQLEL